MSISVFFLAKASFVEFVFPLHFHFLRGVSGGEQDVAVVHVYRGVCSADEETLIKLLSTMVLPGSDASKGADTAVMLTMNIDGFFLPFFSSLIKRAETQPPGCPRVT